MRTRYGQFCPIAKAAELLGERWTILILRELLVGTSRFGDLQRGLSQISPTLLTKRLNQLCDYGLVARKTSANSPRSEYHLTPAGRELRPIVMAMGKWGMKWARSEMDESELDVELLMSDFTRRLDATQLPGGRTVIQFVFAGLKKFHRWWIVVDDSGSRELCVDNPRQTPDIQLRSDVRTMVSIWAGDKEIRAAVREGSLQLSGDPKLIKTLSAWLRASLLARVRPDPRGMNKTG